MHSRGLRARKVALAIAAFAPVVALSGCFQSEAGLVITGDDQVNGEIRVTPEEAYRADFHKWQVPGDMEDRVVVETTDPDTGAMTIQLRQLGFDEVQALVSSASDEAIDVEIERTTAGQVSVTGQADLESAPTAYVALAITFPEAVINSNGSIHNDTVQWELKGGQQTNFWASAPAGETNRNQLLIWTGVVSAIGILAAVLVFLWARRSYDMNGL